MRQIFQSLRDGKLTVDSVPCPSVAPGHVLIRTQCSLISAGTERMLLEFGKASFVEKARQHPDKVRQVWEKVKTDGLAATLDAVSSKLDEPLPLGYCNVGVVLAVGDGVDHVQVGDRVVSNGKHAEVVHVPKHLCAKIPDSVSNESAVFAVVSAIGLQGIRLAQPTMGECVAVTGLGLIGLLTVQLLKAAGCRVLGIDFSPSRLALAQQWGVETVDLSRGEDPISRAATFSRGRGIDAVLITAATDSDEPMRQAAAMCRQRGRIVLVGVTGLNLSRNDYYKKEISFQVSCSYGPGRYDPQYEDQGVDYPIGFVRWTEQRNFEAVLDFMSQGAIETDSLISHRFAQEDAARAYELIGGREPSLGVVLSYPSSSERSDDELCKPTVAMSPISVASLSGAEQQARQNAARVAFVGAGCYATRILMPAFRAAGAELRAVVSRSGATALHAARKFGFQSATTDWQQVLGDAHVDTVVIATRHDSHARFVCEALAAGKHVFVEKPLALSHEQLDQIAAAYDAARDRTGAPVLMVGFNRRFAPHICKAADLLRPIDSPKNFVMTVNAGEIPLEHWVHDPEAGGGRFVGEGCHFVDLLRHLAGQPIVRMQATMLGGSTCPVDDKVTCTLQFADGSHGTIHYLANGHRAMPKERLEIFAAGRVIEINNFRRMRVYGFAAQRGSRLWRQDKGQSAAVAAFLEAVHGHRSSPIPLDQLLEVSRVCLDVIDAAREGRVVRYDESRTVQPLVNARESRRSA